MDINEILRELTVEEIVSGLSTAQRGELTARLERHTPESIPDHRTNNGINSLAVLYICVTVIIIVYLLIMSRIWALI